MKSKLFYILFSIIAMAFEAIDGNTQPLEIGLIQQKHRKVYTEFQIDAYNFPKLIKATNAFAGIQYASAPRGVIMELKNKLLRDSEKDKNYFTGFRIFFGLENNEIRLFLHPVLADKLSTIANTDSVRFYFNENLDIADFVTADSIYLLNGKNINLINPKDLDNVKIMVKNYRTTIQFGVDAFPHSFRGFDLSTDFKSVFFTFQEIDSLLQGQAKDTLFFVSQAHLDTNHVPNLYRHTISISSVNPTTPVGKAPPYVANLAMACPPMCDRGFIVAGEMISKKDPISSEYERSQKESITNEGENPKWWFIMSGIIGLIIGILSTLMAIHLRKKK